MRCLAEVNLGFKKSTRVALGNRASHLPAAAVLTLWESSGIWISKALPAEEREQWNAMLKTDAYELQRLGGLYCLVDNS